MLRNTNELLYKAHADPFRVARSVNDENIDSGSGGIEAIAGATVNGEVKLNDDNESVPKSK